jgi:hypothetical protein
MTTKQRQAYLAYLAECERTDAGAQGAILRVNTPREQELYDAWQAAIEACKIWRDGDTTYQVLSKYQDIDLEMWHCRIVTLDNPQGEISDCYAWALRASAEPVEDEQGSQVKSDE